MWKNFKASHTFFTSHILWGSFIPIREFMCSSFKANNRHRVQKSKSIWRHKKRPMLAPTLTFYGGKSMSAVKLHLRLRKHSRDGRRCFPLMDSLLLSLCSLWELQQAAPQSGLLKVRQFILLPVKTLNWKQRWGEKMKTFCSVDACLKSIS